MTITKIKTAIPIPIGSAYSAKLGIILIHPFFNCCYKLQLIIEFEQGFIPKINIEIPIDYYDDEYNNINEEKMMKKNLGSEEHMNNNNINESNMVDGFTVLTENDFLELIDGKK